MNIRWLLQKDIKSVIEIQKFCPNSPQWTRKDYIDANKSKKTSFLNSKNFPIIYVCEIEKKIVGFIVYKVFLAEILNSKVKAEKVVLNNSGAVDFCLKNGSLFYGDIINFCVHPEYRKKGIGKSLFNFVINKFSEVIDLSKDSCFRPFMLFTIASEKDLGTLNFLKKMNFKASGISRDFFDKDHDAYNFYFQRLATSENSSV